MYHWCLYSAVNLKMRRIIHKATAAIEIRFRNIASKVKGKFFYFSALGKSQSSVAFIEPYFRLFVRDWVVVV